MSDDILKKPILGSDAGILARETELFRKKTGWLVAAYVLLLFATITLACYGIQEAKTLTDAIVFAVEVLVLSIATWAWRREMVVQPATIRWLSQRYQRIYLNGFTVYDFMNLEVQKRMEHYLGKTLSYEMAALSMLALQGHHKSRFIIGEVFSWETQHFYWHGWVEFRLFGIWWTIDPQLNEEFIATRARHNRRRYTQYSRVYKYDEFWGMTLVTDFYEHLARKETSYLLHELYLFHKTTYDGVRMEMEVETTLRNDGHQWNQTLIDIYGRPLTQRMILEYLARRSRLVPRQHTQRQGQHLLNVVLWN